MRFVAFGSMGTVGKQKLFLVLCFWHPYLKIVREKYIVDSDYYLSSFALPGPLLIRSCDLGMQLVYSFENGVMIYILISGGTDRLSFVNSSGIWNATLQ